MHLTHRQVEILGLAASGLAADEIARQLGISPRTVEGHVRVARTRTGARNLTELIALCFTWRILPADPGEPMAWHDARSEHVVPGGGPARPAGGRAPGKSLAP